MLKHYNFPSQKESKLKSWLRIPVEPDEYQPPKLGVFLLQSLVGLLFLVFVVRFWYLQVHKGEAYANQAQLNRMREERIPASRGLILDNDGQVLADNILAYGINIIREDCQDISATLAQVSAWTGIEHSELRAKYLKDIRKVQSFEPMLLVSDLDINLVTKIEAKLLQWPGLEIVTHAKRSYPQRDIYAHILGYVAEANEREMNKNPHLNMGDLVGKQGLELVLEDTLRGIKGLYQREVDVHGRSLSKNLIREPRGGNIVRLTIDTDLQKAAWNALEGKTGSVIVMDPDTGKLAALVTYPAYDNNLFTEGISHKDWNALRENPRFPLQNRVLQSVYPPASVWKLVMTGLFLQEGIKPYETVSCGGGLKVGNRFFRCWHSGHGAMNMTSALVNSCDVYYYSMALRLGIDKIEKYTKASGFGNFTGIPLPHEKTGLVPSKGWKKKRFGTSWVPGETVNTSIGQGYTLVTPLQVAVYVSALLNGGKLLQPQVVDEGEPIVRGLIPATAKQRDFIVQAMRRTAEVGTARVINRQDAIMGGKTGTAQVVKLKIAGGRRVRNRELDYAQRDHAWIATFGAKGDKRYVVIVMLEHGGGGSSDAGPVAKKMYNALFGEKQVPFEADIVSSTLPTLQKQQGMTLSQEHEDKILPHDAQQHGTNKVDLPLTLAGPYISSYEPINNF